MSKPICCPVCFIFSLETISALIPEVTLHISSTVHRHTLSVTSGTKSEGRLLPSMKLVCYCCGLTRQAANHHAAACSVPPSGMGERVRKKVKLMR